MLRILLIGLGPLGRMIASDLRGRGLGELQGAVDVDPKIAGTDFFGITASGDLDAAIAQGGFDCAVVTTSSDLGKCAPTFEKLLRAGCAVVSTCEELSWPWLRHAELADRLDELAKASGGRLLGTGINPGFLMDTLPVVTSAVCRTVERVEAWRIQDATTRRIPFQKKIGATLDDAAFQARIDDGSLRHVGLGESLFFVAHCLGFEIERWDETIEPVKAYKALECGLGKIPVGRAAGVRQVAEGFQGETCRVRLVFQAAIGQDDPHDRVVIEGEPPVDLRIAGGVHGDIGTSAVTLNSIRALRQAPAGLHTMASIPLVSFWRGER